VKNASKCRGKLAGICWHVFCLCVHHAHEDLDYELEGILPPAAPIWRLRGYFRGRYGSKVRETGALTDKHPRAVVVMLFKGITAHVPQVQRKKRHMHKLKKLFGPNALATTVASAMLLHAFVAWAHGCVSVSTSNGAPTCGGDFSTPCQQNVTQGDTGCVNYWDTCKGSSVPSTIYWCCPTADSCSGLLQGGHSPCGAPGGWFCYGYCCPT